MTPLHRTLHRSIPRSGLANRSCRARGATAAVVLALAAAASAAEPTPLAIEKGPGTITISWAGRPLARYQYVPNPNKPYVESLFSPAGLNVLRDSPADHKHHHGVMFAVAVDGVDFWSETATCGRQLDQGTTATRRACKDAAPGLEGAATAMVAQHIAWVSPKGTALLDETRTLEITRLAGGPVTLLVWESRLAPASGRMACTLAGSPYFGLGMRFAVTMDRGGQLFNAEGKTGQAQTNNAPAVWTAYSASVDGKPVTVAMFDLPGNPRPATWFTMDQPFAYISATLALNGKPLAILGAEPIQVRYAVAVWDGKVAPPAIAEVYEKTLTSWGQRK